MIVLYVTRTDISAYSIDQKRDKKQLVTRSTLTQNNLIVFIKQLKQKYDTEQIRILLSNQVSYTLYPILSKPLTAPLRESIKKYVQTEIPEQLFDTEWDYKLLSEDQSTIKVIVFAPILSVWRPILAILTKAKLHIQTVEPEIISVKRHQDPIIGIALKKDISGKDSATLTLPPTQTHNTHKQRYYLLFIVIIIIIASSGLWIFFNLK